MRKKRENGTKTNNGTDAEYINALEIGGARRLKEISFSTSLFLRICYPKFQVPQSTLMSRWLHVINVRCHQRSNFKVESTQISIHCCEPLFCNVASTLMQRWWAIQFNRKFWNWNSSQIKVESMLILRTECTYELQQKCNVDSTLQYVLCRVGIF